MRGNLGSICHRSRVLSADGETLSLAHDYKQSRRDVPDTWCVGRKPMAQLEAPKMEMEIQLGIDLLKFCGVLGLSIG